MPADSTFIEILMNPGQWTLVNVFAVIGSFAAVTGVIIAILPYWRHYRKRMFLEKEFGGDFYLPEEIERSTQYYIHPFCSSVDPGQEAEMRQVEVTEEKLFEKVDKLLAKDSATRHLLLLADSAMGKSSFVLNYYAYNRSRPKRKRHRLAVVPLGHPTAESYIKQIEMKDRRYIVLFLDAFDEDVKAIRDHRKRLDELMQLCQGFRRILITCRTQFFPSDEEIPRKTSVARVAPYGGGEKGAYEFWKLYLSPFTDEQVKEYLQKRYSIWQLKTRKKAQKLIDKIPFLSVRPLLLAYIPDLINSDKEFEHAFQLYEEMVEAWLLREEDKFDIEKEPLRQFSERLAVDIYVNQEKRGGERISKEEVGELAGTWQIPLEKRQLRERSLLNRDAVGNLKFSHRSIMEYLFVKRFIEGEESCKNIPWSDQMQFFLWEIISEYREKGQPVPFDYSEVDLSLYPLLLRYSAKQNLDEEAIKKMLERLSSFDSRWNASGKGISHQYQFIVEKKNHILIDKATGLMWERSGSSKHMTYKKAKDYISQLNRKRFTGFSDWRLPTLEEAMSLMEPEKKKSDLYIDPIFGSKQSWIWTADQLSASRAWYVSFLDGNCNHGDVGFNANYVRAVRSGQLSR